MVFLKGWLTVQICIKILLLYALRFYVVTAVYETEALFIWDHRGLKFFY